jgi:hypothetical protein
MKTFPSEHEVICTGCEHLFLCASTHEPELHERRAASGWKDLCPECNRKDMESWYAHLRTLPETRIYDPLPERKDDGRN